MRGLAGTRYVYACALGRTHGTRFPPPGMAERALRACLRSWEDAQSAFHAAEDGRICAACMPMAGIALRAFRNRRKAPGYALRASKRERTERIFGHGHARSAFSAARESNLTLLLVALLSGWGRWGGAASQITCIYIEMNKYQIIKNHNNEYSQIWNNAAEYERQ